MIRHEFRTLTRGAATLVTASSLVSVAACGGAAPSAKSPESAAQEPESAPASVEEAQLQIAAAKAELGGAPGGAFEPKTGAGTVPSAPGGPPSPTADAAGPPARSSSPTTESQHAAGGRKAGPSGDGRCGSPCRALASMRRAVDALCRMTGPDDARCVDARRTLVDSERHIAPCAC